MSCIIRIRVAFIYTIPVFHIYIPSWIRPLYSRISQDKRRTNRKNKVMERRVYVSISSRLSNRDSLILIAMRRRRKSFTRTCGISYDFMDLRRNEPQWKGHFCACHIIVSAALHLKYYTSSSDMRREKAIRPSGAIILIIDDAPGCHVFLTGLIK